MKVRTWLLPDWVDPELMSGRSAVAIDVLRASTTIVAALEAGAAGVLPFVDIEQAQEAAAQRDPRGLLGGERQGVKIEGFDFGNSPAEFTPDQVAGRTICFTTTNGTRALEKCRPAKSIVVGAFVNRAAVADWLDDRMPAAIVCAGTNGAVTREDVLAAGAILADLVDRHQLALDECDDSSRLALAAWREIQSECETDDREPLIRQLLQTQGGRNVRRLKLTGDLPWAADLDRTASLPKLNPTTGMLTLDPISER